MSGNSNPNKRGFAVSDGVVDVLVFDGVVDVLVFDGIDDISVFDGGGGSIGPLVFDGGGGGIRPLVFVASDTIEAEGFIVEDITEDCVVGISLGIIEVLFVTGANVGSSPKQSWRCNTSIKSSGISSNINFVWLSNVIKS